MKFTLPIALLLSVASATSSFSATSSSSSTACPGQNVFDTCLVTEKGYVDACATTDYGCLCDKWGDVLTCYLQCPNDPSYDAALASKETYCNDAAVYTSTTSSAISRAVSTTATSPTGAANTATDAGAVRTATGTTTGANATGTAKSGAERKLVAGAGGMLMGLAGVVVAVL